eukprot:7166031-Prymnesium_polylepis.1
MVANSPYAGSVRNLVSYRASANNYTGQGCRSHDLVRASTIDIELRALRRTAGVLPIPDRFAVAKSDIEENEPQAYRGASELFANPPPVLFVELMNIKWLQQFAKQHNYSSMCRQFGP